MFRIDCSADTYIRLRLTDIVSSTRCSDVGYTAIHVMADKSYPFPLFSSVQFSRAGAFCYRTRNINYNCLCAINVDVLLSCIAPHRLRNHTIFRVDFVSVIAFTTALVVVLKLNNSRLNKLYIKKTIALLRSLLWILK